MPVNLPEGIRNMKGMDKAKIINVSATSDGLDFMDGLALLLIGLKLTDHLANWTWIEVLAPLWAPFMLSWFIRLIKSTFFEEVEGDEE
jgi:hypothetical protein